VQWGNPASETEIDADLAAKRSVIKDHDTLLAALDPGEVMLDHRRDQFADLLDAIGDEEAVGAGLAGVAGLFRFAIHLGRICSLAAGGEKRKVISIDEYGRSLGTQG